MTLKKKMSRKELKARLRHEAASSPASLCASHREVSKLTQARFWGSSFVITITSINGMPLCGPFAIRDGFSEETIQNLQGEIERSMALADVHVPRTLRERREDLINQMGKPRHEPR